jgi:hypothetical protein
MFWLWGSWCFDCGEVGVSIVEQLVFWLWGIWCFNCEAVDVLIVGQLVFRLWAAGVLIVGQLVFRLWGSWCFNCGTVGVLIVGQLEFWLWGSCAVRAMWWLWWRHPSFSPAVAKAHQWPYSYICWDDLQIWWESCELLGTKWWTANMRRPYDLGIERGVRTFHIKLFSDRINSERPRYWTEPLQLNTQCLMDVSNKGCGLHWIYLHCTPTPVLNPNLTLDCCWVDWLLTGI